MRVLQGLEPSKVFYFFEEISRIPHTSYNEKALSDYCVNFAKERGFKYEQDNMGNVIIFVPATTGYEDADTIMIQGHLDMVGEKTAECDLDLEKDGLKLIIDGDVITADGTTLGGDDGIAVAYALAIMDSDDIPHPNLEIVFTVCEEVGLLGASAIDLSNCKAKKMINIDSEIEGVLTVGCAGGLRAKSHIPVSRISKKGNICNITIKGLVGGHSGTEIHKGRANANSLMGRFLLLLKESVGYHLISMNGGTKENVIPKKSTASVLIDNTVSVKMAIDEFVNQMRAEYGTADPDISVTYEVGHVGTVSVLDELSLKKVLTAVNLMPYGVAAMSMDLPGLVETSSNIGVMELTDGELLLRVSIRSSVSSAKDTLAKKIKMLTKTLGGNVEYAGDYPAWPYKRESAFRDLCVEIFEKQYGTTPSIEMLHAGLECGIFSSKIHNLDCISFGPDLIDIHTPEEYMSISSVARVWEYLKAILAAK